MPRKENRIITNFGRFPVEVKENWFGNDCEKEGMFIGVDFDTWGGSIATERYVVSLAINFFGREIVLGFRNYRL